MITRVKGGELKAECDGDGCLVAHYGGVRPSDDGTEGGRLSAFRGFVEELKGAEWLVRKVGPDWHHFCPACAEDER